MKPRTFADRTLIGATLGLFVLGSPAVALAFGGVFAKDGQSAHKPIDLAQARVVFEVDPGQVTAHIQMSFVGAPEEIAWVIPVDDVPTVEESSLDFIHTLEEKSSIEVRMPASEPCVAATPVTNLDQGGGCSCGSPTSVPQDPAKLQGAASEHPPVLMYPTVVTDSYVVQTIDATSGDAAIAWLTREGFAVSANMAPAIERYTRLGKKLVVVRMQNSGGATDTAPIKLTYPGNNITVPLQLTSVAARPYFSLLVMVLAPETYMPENYVAIPPRPSEILFDDEHNVSYFEWASRASADSSGHLFVSEFIGNNPVPGSRHLYLSRFFTRLSPRQMDDDPIFRPHPNQLYRVEPRIDLIAEPSLYTCNELVPERIPSACAFNYCGERGTCAVVDGTVGCVCEPGDVAETIFAPDGQTRVVCAPRADPFGIQLDETVTPDPCAGVACGEGACVVKHGRATCDCLSNMVACVESGVLTCVAPPANIETYGPGAGVESRPMILTLTEMVPTGAFYAGAIWAIFALALGFRRR